MERCDSVSRIAISSIVTLVSSKFDIAVSNLWKIMVQCYSAVQRSLAKEEATAVAGFH